MPERGNGRRGGETPEGNGQLYSVVHSEEVRRKLWSYREEIS
jgi:hypothetical protein